MTPSTNPPEPMPTGNKTAEQARIGFVVIESEAFPGCYFLLMKNIYAVMTADYFCEQWEVGQTLGGN